MWTMEPDIWIWILAEPHTSFVSMIKLLISQCLSFLICIMEIMSSAYLLQINFNHKQKRLEQYQADKKHSLNDSFY